MSDRQTSNTFIGSTRSKLLSPLLVLVLLLSAFTITALGSEDLQETADLLTAQEGSQEAEDAPSVDPAQTTDSSTGASTDSPSENPSASTPSPSETQSTSATTPSDAATPQTPADKQAESFSIAATYCYETGEEVDLSWSVPYKAGDTYAVPVPSVASYLPRCIDQEGSSHPIEQSESGDAWIKGIACQDLTFSIVYYPEKTDGSETDQRDEAENVIERDNDSTIADKDADEKEPSAIPPSEDSFTIQEATTPPEDTGGASLPVWSPLTAKYTVVYWVQNANDDAYSYRDYETVLNTPAGETVTRSSGGTPSIPHFAFESADTITVAPDGSSILNVYYSRNLYTFTFVDTDGSTELHTITAKYDADITAAWNAFVSQYASDSVWQSSLTGNYYSVQEKMPGQDITLKRTIWTGSAWTWDYWLESLDGKVPEGATTKSDNGVLYYKHNSAQINSNTVINLTYDEDYYSIDGFTQRDATVPGFVNQHADLFYKRNHYTLSLYNYNDIIRSDDVYFEASLSPHRIALPAHPDGLPDSFTFKGWFTTEQCFAGSEVNWSKATMPSSNLVLYAKWQDTSAASYIVHYVDASSGAELFPSAFRTGIVGKSVTETALAHASYFPDKNSKTLTSLSSDSRQNQIWFYYSRAEQVCYKVECINAATGLPIEDETGWTKNTKVTVTPQNIAGYECISQSETKALAKETDPTAIENNVISFIYKPIIQVGAQDAEKEYDGKALRSNASKITGNVEAMRDGDVARITTVGAITDVGSLTNRVTSYQVLRSDGGAGFIDVTNACYSATLNDKATLTIAPAPLYVITPDASKRYDGSALAAEGSYKGLAQNESISFTTTGSQTTVGSSLNTYEISWDSSTAKQNNYRIVENLGTLTVEAAPAPPPSEPPAPPGPFTPSETDSPIPPASSSESDAADTASTEPSTLSSGITIIPITSVSSKSGATGNGGKGGSSPGSGSSSSSGSATVIEDDENPLASHALASLLGFASGSDQSGCSIHWYILGGIVVTSIYACAALMHRRRDIRLLYTFECAVLDRSEKLGYRKDLIQRGFALQARKAHL